MRNFLLYTCFISSFLIQLKGQSESIEKEIASAYEAYHYKHVKEFGLLTTNDNIFYSGGAIEFGLLVMDQYYLPSYLSKIAYIELIHEDGLFHDRYVFQLDSGIVNSSINIPLDIPTGNYQLVAYTYFMKNYEMDMYADRSLIFIQNVFERPTEMASGLVIPDTTNNQQDHSSKISVSDIGAHYLIKVDGLTKKSSINHYLVSEGLRSLQFIARLKGKANEVRIPKSQFKGQLQRLILMDEDKQVKEILNFMINSAAMVELSGASVSLRETNCQYIGQSKGNRNLIMNRLGKFFFELNGTPVLNKIANTGITLVESSSKEHSYWHRITDATDFNNFTYLPEERLQLRGSIKPIGKEDRQGINMSIRFFRNQMDLTLPISDEQFSIDLLVVTGRDEIFFSILDDEGLDVSDDYAVSLESQFNCKYIDHLYSHDKAYSDSLINASLEFNYIISTFNDTQGLSQFFWSRSEQDEVILTADYINLGTTEKFFREALPKVSVNSSSKVVRLTMHNPDPNKFYDQSPIVIVNNQVLRNETLLFELPLETIESIGLIYEPSTLIKFGAPFKNGVILVKTHQDYAIPALEVHPNFKTISTYASSASTNELIETFCSKVFLEGNRNGEVIISRFNTLSKDPYYQKEILTQNGTFTTLQGYLRCSSN